MDRWERDEAILPRVTAQETGVEEPSRERKPACSRDERRPRPAGLDRVTQTAAQLVHPIQVATRGAWQRRPFEPRKSSYPLWNGPRHP
jgi:hypothetical protein